MSRHETPEYRDFYIALPMINIGEILSPSLHTAKQHAYDDTKFTQRHACFGTGLVVFQ